MIIAGMFKPKNISFYKWMLYSSEAGTPTAYLSDDPTNFAVTTTPTFLIPRAYGVALCNRSTIILGEDVSGDTSGFVTGPQLANIGITEITNSVPPTTTPLYGGMQAGRAYFTVEGQGTYYTTLDGVSWTSSTLASVGVQPFGPSTSMTTFGRMRNGRWVMWVTDGGGTSVNYYSDDTGHPAGWVAPGLTPNLGRGDALQHSSGRTWFVNSNANSNVYTTDGVSWISTGVNSVVLPSGNMKTYQYADDGAGTWLTCSVTGNTMYIHRSVDNGLNWTQVHSKAGALDYPRIIYADGTFVATAYNTIEVSTDNGDTWTTSTGPTGRWMAVPLYI